MEWDLTEWYNLLTITQSYISIRGLLGPFALADELILVISKNYNIPDCSRYFIGNLSQSTQLCTAL